MQKSLSVSRQDTFDTGRAQLDKRGSIRRGDVELPVVDENCTRQLSSDKSHSDSGLESQTSADRHRPSTSEHPVHRNRSPSRDKIQPSITAAEGASGSDKEGRVDAEQQLSPRYVDHNKLFPETETRYAGTSRRKSQTRKSKYDETDSPRSEEVDSRRSGDKYARHVHKDRFEEVGKQTDRSRKKSVTNIAPPDNDRRRKVSIGETFDKPAESSGATPTTKNSLTVEPGSKSETIASREKGKSSVPTSVHISKQHHESTVSSNLSPRHSVGKDDLSQKQRRPSVHTKSTDKGTPNNEGHSNRGRTTSSSVPKLHGEEHVQKGIGSSNSQETSDQRHAKKNPLARLKGPANNEDKLEPEVNTELHPKQRASQPTGTLDVTVADTHSAFELSTQRNKNRNEKTDLQDISHVQQKPQEKKKSDTKQTPRVEAESQKHKESSKNPEPEAPNHTAREYKKAEEQTSRPKQFSLDQTQSQTEQSSRVPKKHHLQRTPAIQPSPGGHAGSDTIPRLSLESKKPGDTDHTLPSDRRSKSPSKPENKTEHLKTNIVKGTAWEQKASTADHKTEKQTATKTDQPKSSAPPLSTKEPSKTSSDAQIKSTMALAQGRPPAGDTLAGVTAERDQLLRAERTYKQRILQLEEEVKAVVKQSQELSSENKALRTKLEAYEDKAYGGSLELKELRREKQELVGIVAKANAEKQDVDAENEKLKARLGEMEGKSKQWDTIYVENNKLKTKQAELERKIQELEKEKNGLQTNLKTADSKNQDKMEAVQNENKKLQAELINLQTKNNALERKAERLQTENKEISETLEQKRTELDELMRAMKTETAAEVELKEIHSELEVAQTKLSDYKKDLDEANRRYQNAEKEKDDVKTALRSKETECKTLKANVDEKESQISDLKRQVDAAKRNVKRLEDEMEDSKQVEKDAINLKARIRSLKNEIEDSLAANHKMKQERTDARLEADRLNRELAAANESLTEAKRYIKKLEGDRSSREKKEEELELKKKREQELERQLFDLTVRNDQLKQRVRELQEDKDELVKTRSGVTEVEAMNRKLQDDNRKLRQMLVERNMELAHRQSERVNLAHRVDSLERKQVDADIKVQQLKGWVDTVNAYSEPLPPAQPLLALPPVPAHGAPKAAPAGGRSKKKRQQQQHQQNKLNRSWEDMKKMDDPTDSIHTTPSLPVVLDSKFAHAALPGGSGPPGYYEMYKHKMKLIRERRW